MPASNVHLVVIHHGLWGSPSNTAYLTTTLARSHGGTISPTSPLASYTPPESASTIAVHAETHPNAKRSDVRLVVLNSGVNEGDRTYDGVDWCGERLVREVYEEVERIENDQEAQQGEGGDEGKPVRVSKISFVGYSLGGLVVRYAVGVLYADGFFSDSSRSGSSPTGAEQDGGKKEFKFKSRPMPASLSTIATPHLGVTLTGSTFSKVSKYVGSRMLGRSGKQLYLADRGWIPPLVPTTSPSSAAEPEANQPAKKTKAQGEGMCMIEALSDPRFTFLAALKLFARVDIYANATADLTVSYRTAAFEPFDPFAAPPEFLSLTRDRDFPALLVSYAAVEHPISPKRPLWKKLSPKNLPWILNPQRFPFGFPLNYFALICLPVVLPVMLSLVLHKLGSDSKKSNARVDQLARLWGLENGHLPNPDPDIADSSSKADLSDGTKNSGRKDSKKEAAGRKLDNKVLRGLEEKRISKLLARVEASAEEAVREMGEDYVATEQPSAPTTTTSPPPSSSSTSSPSASAHQDENGEEDRYSIKPNNPTLSLSPLSAYPTSTSQPDLTPTQLRIASNLNNRSNLPQVKKHLAYFQDVLNAHAVIIVRTTTTETHREGMSLIKAFVQRFQL